MTRLMTLVLAFSWLGSLCGLGQEAENEKVVSDKQRASRASAYRKVAETLRYLKSEDFRRRERIWTKTLEKEKEDPILHELTLLQNNEYFFVIASDIDESDLEVSLYSAKLEKQKVFISIERGRAVLYFKPKLSGRYYLRMNYKLKDSLSALALGYAYR